MMRLGGLAIGNISSTASLSVGQTLSNIARQSAICDRLQMSSNQLPVMVANNNKKVYGMVTLPLT